MVLPINLQTITFGEDLIQPMEMLALPGSLLNLTFGNRFNKPMEKVALPRGVQNLTFGKDFDVLKKAKVKLKNRPLPKGLHC
jgi:hypothetical protein